MKNVSVLFLSLSLLLPIFAHAAGAIAVDDEQGETEPGYGLATGADTRADAARDAMKFCREEGNKGCKVVVRFDECGAYAASKKYYGIGYGKSLAKAESMALEACGNSKCKILVSDCE